MLAPMLIERGQGRMVSHGLQVDTPAAAQMFYSISDHTTRHRTSSAFVFVSVALANDSSPCGVELEHLPSAFTRQHRCPDSQTFTRRKHRSHTRRNVSSQEPLCFHVGCTSGALTQGHSRGHCLTFLVLVLLIGSSSFITSCP